MSAAGVLVRKARRSGTCPACRAGILVGQLITAPAGSRARWKHLTCPAPGQWSGYYRDRRVDTIRPL